MHPREKLDSATPAQARTLREAIEGAFEDLGGRAWLVSLAREHPNVFATLLRALIARDVNLGAKVPGEIRISWAGERGQDEYDAESEAGT